MGSRTVTFGLLAITFCVAALMVFNKAHPPVLAGPIDDVFRRHRERLVIIYGTGGEDAEALRDYAHKVAELMGRRLDAELLVYPDTEAGPEVLENYSLLLYGPVGENRVTDRMRESLPFGFEGDAVTLGERRFAGSDWRLVFAIPNPHNPKYYALIYTAAEAAAVVGINLIESPNFVHHDTTDYVLAVGAEVVAQGHLAKDGGDGRWSFRPESPAEPPKAAAAE